jgi:hypothetical protein
LEEDVVIEIESTEGNGMMSCAGSLSVDVLIHVLTSESGVDETGSAVLTALPASSTEASLSYTGTAVNLQLQLEKSGDDLTIEGSLSARDDGLPAKYATVGGESSGAGGSGGAP